MTGKLHLDLGDDYAFDPRRAKAVAEGVGGQAPQQPTILGPFTTQGVTWWLETVNWNVWVNIDADPEPDLAVPLAQVLANPLISDVVKGAIRSKAEAYGWGS